MDYRTFKLFQLLLILLFCVIMPVIGLMSHFGKESFTMENIVMIIVTVMGFVLAVISFVILLITESRFHRKDTHRFDEIDGQNKDLKSEHAALRSGLSTEHAALKSDLGEKLNKLESRQESIKTRIFDYISKEEVMRDTIQTILPQQEDVHLQIQLLYDKIITLSEENKEVRQENRQISELKQQIEELKQQLTKLRRQNKELNRLNYQLQEQNKLQPKMYEQLAEDFSREEAGEEIELDEGWER